MNSDLHQLSPDYLKKLSVDELTALAADIRQYLIGAISTTGGHIGANLGVVELTLAVHAVFDSPQDAIIFDTGHQGYIHKLITGRQEHFSTLNTWGGMSRFVSRHESEHDTIDASHAGTSISIASGMAWSFKVSASPQKVVAIIGDGSMVEGMAFEELNFVAGSELPLVIVLNDNEMAIAPNIGGIRNLTTGQDWQEKSRAFFEGLGLSYLAVEDGHDLASLVSAMREAHQSSHPVLVHVKTEKGRGLSCADGHPYKMHFSMPFDPVTGKGANPTVAGKTMALVAAQELEEILQEDPDVVLITPATPYASYLDRLISRFPDRVIDVGMAEQQAVGMAVGMALRGKKPVVCIQTTFMQRAYDQLLHDVCYMDVPVTILGVRSGFSGYDSPTHHGIFDIPYLRSFPNMQIIYPTDSHDMRALLRRRMASPKGPMTILHPYEPIEEPELRSELEECEDVYLVEHGKDGLILTLPNRSKAAIELQAALKVETGLSYGVAVIRQIKPFPVQQVLDLCQTLERVITLEESALAGGFGSLIAETFADFGVQVPLMRFGVNDQFVAPGTKEECSRDTGLDTQSIVQTVVKKWAAPSLRAALAPTQALAKAC